MNAEHEMATTDGLGAEHTLATRANMERAALLNPRRRIIALSLSLAEEYSATPGDYWANDADEVIKDSQGEPLILVFRVESIVDAVTGEEV